MEVRWSFAALRSLLVLIAPVFACSPERPSILRGAPDASAGATEVAASSEGATQPVTAAPGQASPPIDVGGVIRRVHFAYRAEGDGFAGGHSTYAVRARGNGQLSFTPYLYVARDRTATEGASFAFETLGVARGDQSIAGDASPAHVDDEGALVWTRRGITERLRNDERGVEQSWAFAERPKGAGDLVVRVRVAGLEYRGATPTGLHFVDPKTGLGARYGSATWVDAHGDRSRVISAYRDGEITLRVAAADVERASYPAVLDPTIGTEFGTDSPVYGAAPGNETTPAITYAGGNFMVVWEDDRAATTNVYGTRVSAAGSVLDLAGIPIASGTVSTHMSCGGSHCGPQVTYDGANYLVVWMDNRTAASKDDVYGRRVSIAGAVVGSDFVVGASPSDQAWLGVASDGTNSLVVWTDFGTTYNVHGSLVSQSGVVQGTPDFTVTSEFESYAPQVAFDGTNYMVVWEYLNGSYREIHGMLVSKTGTLPVPAGYNLSSGSTDRNNPAITFDATSSNYFIVYDQDAGGGNSDIYGKRVSTAGVVPPADASGIAIGTSTNTGFQPNVAFDGANNFYVVWNTYAGARGARVSKGGALVDGPASGDGVAVGSGNRNPAVAFGGGTFLAVYASSAYNPADVNGNLITTGGVVGSLRNISTSANAQHAPAVAFDGTNYLLVWEDDRPGVANVDIYGTRVSKAGAVIDTSGISIATATGNQVAPAIVFDGSSYYVVWEDHRGADADIYGSQVSKLGIVADPIGLKISGTATGDQRVPAVGFNGTDYWVAWEDYRNGSTADIYGARVSTGGTLRESAGVSITTAAQDQKVPAVSCDGANCLVVWQDYRSGASYDIYGARMAPGGGFVGGDSAGIPISAASFDQKSPAVAFDGNNYFVVWSDARATGLTPDIYGARVSKAGAVLDATGIAISTAAGDQTLPAVAYAGDGVNYLVAWADKRTGPLNDIYASWVSTGGSVLDPSGVLVSADPTEETLPAIATEGAGHSLIAYQKFDPSGTPTAFGTERVRARLAYSGTLVGSGCAGGSTCATRFCSESYCCDKACNGPCQTCGATPGTCTSVVSADDPDHCPMTTSTCDAAGACRLRQGQACTPPGTNCLSGNCVDGFCCDKPCAGGCDECASTPGTCKVVAMGNGGANPSCNPGVCDGVSPNCPGGCASDAGCGTGTYCAAGGTCQPQKTQGQACDSLKDCADNTNCHECGSMYTCVDGFCCNAACSGACDTCSATPGTCTKLSKAVDGSPSCSPYFCTGTSDACGVGCVDDSECVSNYYCNTTSGKCVPDEGLGKSCTSKTQCQSGFCIDGVCCDEACGGTCRACTALLKGGGQDGTCSFISAGTDPANECAQDNVTSCQRDGTCDGAGACRLYVKGSSCGATSCVGNNVIGQVCNGLGVCGLDNSGIACAPYTCATGKCSNPCATSNDCTSGNFCFGGTCKLKSNLGATCLSGAECLSNSCVEGICCDSACTGKCQTCLAAHQKPGGVDGTCDFAAAGDDPHDDCADDGTASCGKDGQCDGAGQCRSYAQGTVCAPPACAMNAPTKAQINACSNATCMTTSTDCAPYGCSGGECQTKCMSGADCASTAYCNAGKCEAKKKNGDLCTADSSCTSGICADGVCCNVACKGQCEACNDKAAAGTCVPVSGKPAAGRMPCDATPPADACAATSCDGTTRDKCAGFVGPSVSCRKAGCTAGVATSAASCNGKGQCPAAQTQMCDPYVCDADACKTSCASAADCVSGFKCDMGKCVPGATCRDDHTLVSATGMPTDCTPYKCAMGECGTKCASIDDCLMGFACDANGACVPTAGGPAAGGAAADQGGGCGCRTAGSGASGHAGWLSFLLGMTLLSGRMRRVRGRAALAVERVNR